MLQGTCLVAARTQNKMGIIYYLSLRSDVSHQASFNLAILLIFRFATAFFGDPNSADHQRKRNSVVKLKHLPQQ